jgi:hypothetical protein
LSFEIEDDPFEVKLGKNYEVWYSGEASDGNWSCYGKNTASK